MCVFYEFLLSDKDDVQSILKLNRKHQIEFQDTENRQLLLASIQAQFQKVALLILFINSLAMAFSHPIYLTNSVFW